MTKKWFLVPGFIGIVFLIAGFLIQDCLLFLFKWNLITRYPVIFNFRVGTGRVLKKKFGTGRVLGSRRPLVPVSGPAFGTIPHVFRSVCPLERYSTLLFGIVLLWECKNKFIRSVCIRNMNAGSPKILTSEQSAFWNWLILKNCSIQRLSSNLFEKQHADALLRPSREMQLKEVQTIFLAVVITIFHCQ